MNLLKRAYFYTVNRYRKTYHFPILDAALVKQKLQHYYKSNLHFILLDSNHSESLYSDHNCLIAVGCIDEIKTAVGTAFDDLELFRAAHQDWMFGYLSYDLKNEIEDLKSNHHNYLQVFGMHFFVPEIVFEIQKDQLIAHSSTLNQKELQQLLKEVFKTEISYAKIIQHRLLKARDQKKEYLEKAQRFLDHIQRGDIYEANFCTEFYAQDVQLDSLKAFETLNQISEPPFAVYARMDDLHVMCASPERYLKKVGDKIISQPIKGTARRSQHLIEDEALKVDLYNDPKERSENVMIVDLVRNDLSRTAVKGSVTVEELYGIYSFKQVHQMISTISSSVKDTAPLDVIKTTFPMGSMTGAPKISAMNIIEHNESFYRGLYSGSIGYFTPDGDFDFNVVIRSILYNASTGYVSYAVGSAITAAAIPEKEYEECLLKAKAMMQVLNEQGISFD